MHPDLERVIAPMIPAPDAIHLDSTGLTVQQVVERMEAFVRLAFAKSCER